MYKHFKVQFGPKVPNIRDQLKTSGLKTTDTNIEKWQSISDAVETLVSNNLLPHSQSFKCRHKLIRHMSNTLNFPVIMEILE